MNKKRKPLELYVHIPFCIRKCAYCDFVSGPGTKAMQKEYEEALLAEIDAAEETAESEVISAFFGGGTPSAVDAGMLARVMEKLRSKYVFSEDAEITLEVNPGTLDAEKLKCYRKSGFNRISIGCQSVHDEELKRLGRIHTFAEFQESFVLARDAGFANINVDLMSGLPEQSEEKWEESLRTIAELSPEHISAYSLIVEEGTPFSRHVEQLPDEDTERYMYHLGTEYLKGRGYEQYEISNYARKGFESRHNCKYWKRENYLGLGLGASSMIENVRFKNTPVFRDYLAGDFKRKKEQVLSLPEQMEEFMFLGLRMRDGVDERRFEELFGKKLREVYAEPVQKYLKLGLLEEIRDLQKGPTRLTLTARGIDVSNTVMADFLFD
jgi:oxygen-independent coproporphyrinogen-3 oxidase